MSDNTNERSKEQSQKDCFFFFKNNIFLVLGMGIAVAICMYGILGIYGFSFFPDEFGYWAPAATVLGYDWSDITALGSYYSYGYSIILLPILLLFRGGVSAYRAAVVLNLLLQCLSIFLLYYILDELYPGEKKEVRSIMATVAALFPAWLFYVQTTMVEALLNFGVIFSVFIMLRFLKKPGIINGAILAAILIYLYLVHMRCLGIIGAGAVTLFIWLLSHRKEGAKKSFRGLLLLAVLAILFAITFILKDKVISVLYHGSSDFVLSWNDYSGIMYRLKKIVSIQGIGYLLKDICGKVLYMGLATFGIAYFGVVGCFRKASAAFKAFKAKTASYRDFLWIYVLLVVVFQFLVALIYLNGASAPDAGRLDNFLHGRYIDFFLPILIVIGLEEMLRGDRIFLIFEVNYLVMLITSMVGMYVISTNDTQLRNAHGYTMVGMSFLLPFPLSDTIDYYHKEVIFRVIITLLVAMLFISVRRIRQEVIISALLIIQVILGVHACTEYIFDTQDVVAKEIVMGERLQDLVEEYPDKQIVHVYETGAPSIELVQFNCRDLDIMVLNGEENDIDITQYMSDDIILIIQPDQPYEAMMDEFYKEKWVLGNLIMYMNP